jgi:hypothetical protein
MGFEPTDGTLGRYCLTTWRHPHDQKRLYAGKGRMSRMLDAWMLAGGLKNRLLVIVSSRFWP